MLTHHSYSLPHQQRSGCSPATHHCSVLNACWAHRSRPLTSLVARICPFIFFTFLSFLRKYLQETLRRQQNTYVQQVRALRGSAEAKGESLTRTSQTRASPELRPRAYRVCCPKLHPVHCRLGLLLCRQVAAHHLVLVVLVATLQVRNINISPASSICVPATFPLARVQQRGCKAPCCDAYALRYRLWVHVC